MPRRLLGLISEAGEGSAEKGARSNRYSWFPCRTRESFLRELRETAPDVVLVSFGVEGVDENFLKTLASAGLKPGSFILSAPDVSLELAVLARRLAAGPLLREPIEGDEIEAELRRRVPVTDPLLLTREPGGDEDLVGSGPAMARVVRLIAEIGTSSTPVLITGESGTGKELVAQALHRTSERRDRPFIAINCAAVPEPLLESEFFGHERGAFTGAVSRKRGRFERAHGGTLFLDEIGDMSLVLQAKLLRALEEGEIERVGGEEAVKVDVRVLAATNRELELRVRDGSFREDLYYRLAAARVALPPLRERMEDLEDLVIHFTGHFARQYARDIRGLDGEAVRLLKAHRWPGNVRELRNVLDQAVRSSRGGWIRIDDLRIGVSAPRLSSRDDSGPDGYPPTASLEDVERDHILRVLEFTSGTMGEAATILGIHRNTLTRKVERYGLRDHVRGD
jgi:DNA-binding NtrC family response regulator